MLLQLIYEQKTVNKGAQASIKEKHDWVSLMKIEICRHSRYILHAET